MTSAEDDSSLAHRCLIGREGAIDAAVRALTDVTCRGVVVIGDAGTGTTTVAHEVANHLRAVDVAVIQVEPGELPDLVAAGPRPGRVVVVDDLGALDRLAVAAVEALLVAGAVVLATARRTDAGIPELADTMLRTGRVVRIELANLAGDDVDRLATCALGNEVDHQSLDALVRLTGGNPRRLAVLLTPVANRGLPPWFHLVDSVVRIDDRLASANLAPRIVAADWRRLDPTVRVVIALVARVRVAPLSVLLASFDPGTITRAEATGLVRSTTSARSFDTVTPSSVSLSATDPVGIADVVADDPLTGARVDEVLLAVPTESALPAGPDPPNVHPTTGPEAALDHAVALLLLGRPAEALGALPPEAQYPPFRPDVIRVLGAALAAVGRPLSGVAKARQAGSGSGATAADIVEVACLGDAGHLAEAMRAGRAGYDLALRLGDRSGQASFALSLAQACLLDGSATQARRWYAEAAIVFGELDQARQRGCSLAGAAAAAAQEGATTTAEQLAGESDRIARGDLVLDPRCERLRALVDLNGGDVAAGVERLERALAWCGDTGYSAVEVAIAFDLVCVDRALVPDTVARLRRSRFEGELLEGRRRFVIAAVDGDPNAIAGVAERFESIGCRSPALEAWTYAGHAAVRAGDETRRRVARRRCQRLLAAGVTYQVATARGDAASTCSPRELEVARLAAAGVPRRTIAADLFISRRTVDRHLNAVFAKLGVTSRAELADVLGGAV